MKKPTPFPTAAELAVLRILWTRPDGATLRDVCDASGLAPDASANGTSNLLQRMVERQLVRVLDARRPRRYVAAVTQEQTMQSMLGVTRKGPLAMTIAKLVRSALGSRKITRDEVEEVKRILDEHKADDVR